MLPARRLTLVGRVVRARAAGRAVRAQAAVALPAAREGAAEEEEDDGDDEDHAAYHYAGNGPAADAAVPARAIVELAGG